MEATTLCCDPRLMESVQQQLLRRVFQMCDVQRRGHISIDDLLELGQSYLGQDTKVFVYVITCAGSFGNSLEFYDVHSKVIVVYFLTTIISFPTRGKKYKVHYLKFLPETR